jgi:Mn-dependent DtxR family transcriptional regulator
LNSYRSSFTQTLEVLKSIERGEPPEILKNRLQLSRYSFEYTMNRLLSNKLIELNPEDYYKTTQKGKNILTYNKKDPLNQRPVLLELLGLNDSNSL